MVWTKEQKRAARLAARPAFPRPRGPAPFGCTWNTSCGGWFMDGKEVTIVRNRKRSARATLKRPDHQRSLLGKVHMSADWCVHAPARLAARPAFPRPRGPAPFGCTWNTSCGGWFMDGKEVTIVRNRKRSARATLKRPDHQRSLLGKVHMSADWCVHAPPTRAPMSPKHTSRRRAPN